MKNIMLMAVLMTALVAAAEDVVVVWIPKANFNSAMTARQNLLVELWGKSQSAKDKAWADSGWMEGVDADGATGMVYIATMRQTGGRATVAKVAQWKTALLAYGIKIWTGLNTYLDSGIRPVETGLPH